MNITNFTRKFVPLLSDIKAENIKAIQNIPENRLAQMIQSGDKSVVQVGMNQSAATRILPNGINTLYTDGLAGCNATLLVSKGLDGNPIALMSHYTPLEKSRQLNVTAFEKQLNAYSYYMDPKTKPKVFFNVRGEETQGVLKEVPNPIMEQLNGVLKKFFPQGIDQKVIPYSTKNISPFDSHAMIAQFDKNKMKLTTVGEKEHFIDLNA
ncbi:MAG: hypothetical protein PHE78_01375 [Candidatus Gastranaerophilales bacterium]|nr:hypothetical protein [Candidatus Gastranaerophilales bacterium]